MLDEGLRAGCEQLGIEHRTVCHVECDAQAAAILVARMEEESLDKAPVWSDVTTFDASAFRGKVDCIVAGFPCQDLSVAGKQVGITGQRSGLFYRIIDVADQCDANFLWLENVPGIFTAPGASTSCVCGWHQEGCGSIPVDCPFCGLPLGSSPGQSANSAFGDVLRELASHGFDARWMCLRASEVGASHDRARWFLWAWRKMGHAGRLQRSARYEQDRPGETEGGTHQENGRTSDRSGVVGDARLQHEQLQQRSVRNEFTRGGCDVGDARCVRDAANQPGSVCECSDPSYLGLGGAALVHANVAEQISQDQACGEALFAPGPRDAEWEAILVRAPHLSPSLEPTFRGVVNGMAFRMADSRTQRLKCAGNGVVAAQAGYTSAVLIEQYLREIAYAQPMSLISTIKSKLEHSGFDGLHVAGECACLKDDLAPCGSCNADDAGWINGCEPGYRHNDPRPGRGNEWVISGSKLPMTAEDFDANID